VTPSDLTYLCSYEAARRPDGRAFCRSASDALSSFTRSTLRLHTNAKYNKRQAALVQMHALSLRRETRNDDGTHLALRTV